jgi:hypothetical protein
MDAIERIAREAGAYQVMVEALTGLVDEERLTDAQFRALARHELAAGRRHLAELRAEAGTRV